MIYSKHAKPRVAFRFISAAEDTKRWPPSSPLYSRATGCRSIIATSRPGSSVLGICMVPCAKPIHASLARWVLVAICLRTIVVELIVFFLGLVKLLPWLRSQAALVSLYSGRKVRTLFYLLLAMVVP